MNKQIIRLGLFFLVFMIAFSSQAQAVEGRVALLPFTVNAPDAATIGQRVQTLMQEKLVEYGFTVVTRPGQPPANANAARQVATAANAQYAMYGTYNQVGNGFNLDVRVAKVQSNIVRPFYAEGNNATRLNYAVDSVVAQIPVLIENQSGIARIDVRGLRVLDPSVIKLNINSKVGNVPNAETMDEDVRTIWGMGYFSDVSAALEPNPLGVGEILVFNVVEKPRIANVVVQDGGILGQDDVLGVMTSGAGTVLNEKVLAEDLQAIKNLYSKKGYYLADVSYVVQGAATDRGSTLAINITPGNKLYIQQVNMVGVDEAMQKKLRRVTKLRKRGLFSFFTKYGVLEEEFLQRDMDAIQSILVGDGYLESVVAFPTINYEPNGIVINFNIQQGQRYKIGTVDFAGDLLEDKESLAKLIKLDDLKNEGAFFSVETMQKDIKALTNLYADYGFAFAQVEPSTPMNREAGTVDVIYQLRPNAKVFIRNVILEGNTETRDNVILRELRIADGQEYDGAKVRRSIERLEKLGYFSEVGIELIPTELPGEVDLKVNVKEASTGSISMGLGYSTYDQLGVSASINQKNLFGRGYGLGVNGYVSGRTLSMRGNFVNPRINDTKLGFISSLYAEDEEWPDYERRTVGGQFGVFYPLGEYTSISTSYRLEFYELTDIAPNASSAIQSYAGNNIASVVTVGISRDTTNHPLNPTRGTKESITLEYGGGFLGGSDDFYKVTGTFGFYYGLTDNHVLHARGTLGAVFENGNNVIPAFERYYIGGMNSLRGYDFEDVSPMDPRTGESIGATRVGYGSLEYIWRVNEEFGIFLVPFFDFATSFDDQFDSWGDRLYYSSGLEVRWNSPFGAIRIAYGIPFTDSVDGQNLDGRFEFSMGRAF